MRYADSLPTYLSRVVERFDQDCDAIIQNLVRRIEKATTPSRIYHYTSARGLDGILGSGTLWCSDVFTLNDPSEIIYGLRRAVLFLQSQAETKDERLLAKQLEGFASDAAAHAIAHFFVCSFSTVGDDLNQWRAYGDNGRGYVLGFDTAILEEIFVRNNGTPIENNSAYLISYDERELDLLVQSLIELFRKKATFIRRAMPASADAFSGYMTEILITLVLHLYRLSLFFKHPAYRSEGEYRFLQLFRGDKSPPATETRQREDGEVRFRPFSWKLNAPRALVSVGIGPAANVDSAEETVAHLLAANGFTNVMVSRSVIPYRVDSNPTIA